MISEINSLRLFHCNFIHSYTFWNSVVTIKDVWWFLRYDLQNMNLYHAFIISDSYSIYTVYCIFMLLLTFKIAYFFARLIVLPLLPKEFAVCMTTTTFVKTEIYYQRAQNMIQEDSIWVTAYMTLVQMWIGDRLLVYG